MGIIIKYIIKHIYFEVFRAKRRFSLIIAKAGKAMVKVLPLSAEDRNGDEKLGFMAGLD
jgi:hypothetical protein